MGARASTTERGLAPAVGAGAAGKSDGPAGSQESTPDWHIRAATDADVPAVTAAARALLLELGAAAPPAAEVQEAARALLADRESATVLVAQAGVAQAGEELVGLLGASWQSALHVPGRYGLIQDLWVRPAWRGRSIGAELLEALVSRAHELGIARIEVGLPRAAFPGLAATEAFYRANGFLALGARMRRVLS